MRQEGCEQRETGRGGSSDVEYMFDKNSSQALSKTEPNGKTNNKRWQLT